jgi:hypothetical protein
MHNELYLMAERAHAFVECVTAHIGREQLHWLAFERIHHPILGGQPALAAVATQPEPAEGVVQISQRQSVFELSNWWGFAVQVRSWPQDAHRRRKPMFESVVLVDLEVDIDPEPGRMESGNAFEHSLRPQRHERESFHRIQQHNRALTRALREQGYRRCRATYTPPNIQRAARDDDARRVQESCACSMSSWTLATATAEDMAGAVAGLMDLPLAVQLDAP